MPLKYFTCPDGGRIEIAACLAEGGCRMQTRCAARPYLRLAGSQRTRSWVCNECGERIIGNGQNDER